MQPYGRPYGLGSIIGVHLDMWKGTLQFYLNRKPLGSAADSADCCEMEISDDGVPKNEDDYDSDADEYKSLAIFCAHYVTYFK